MSTSQPYEFSRVRSVKPVDAIIVPTARDSSNYYPVHFAVSLSDLLRVHNVIIRDETIAQARNHGLTIARACGWEYIMFLDDDIRLHEEKIIQAAVTLRSVQAVAFTAREFPDNSVVRHAARAAGMVTPVYPSGSALLVNMKKIPDTRLFPEIYNEDWLFLHGLDMVNGGDAEQLPYNPFVPGRAAREESGDLIAEALQDKPVTYDKGFWENAIAARKDLLDSIHGDGDAALSVQEAAAALAGIEVPAIRKFLRYWQGRCC